jgi:hypothetical protein
MAGRVLRCAVLLIVAAMLSGHVSELFDHWDHTLRTGREADYTLVVIAACAGLEVVLALTLVRLFRVLQAERLSPGEPSLMTSGVTAANILVAGPSPPLLLSLRI